MAGYLNTKLGKTRCLNEDEELRKAVPDARKANAQTVRDMLHAYKMVYVKPNLGAKGKGVIRAERREAGGRPRFRYKIGVRTALFESYDVFYASLKRNFGKHTYLVQKGIRTLKYRGRPFDIRVMVQKNKSGLWEHTGSIGRLAHPKRVVTNCVRGGTALPLGKLLKPHMKAEGRAKLEKELAKLGVSVAKHMQRKYPGVKQIGLDVGIDRSMNPWIFEVNTRPDPYLFRYLNNPAIYSRILQLARFNGSISSRSRSKAMNRAMA